MEALLIRLISDNQIIEQNPEIFPTEVCDGFYVKNAENSILEIYSLSGKKCLQQTVNTSNQKVNVGATIPAGVYLVKIHLPHTTRILKIVKL